MKKYIYLFITVFLFSCAGNDDIIGNEIAGNWKLTAVLVDGSPVNTSCELESNMTMLETNTGNYYKYDEDDFENIIRTEKSNICKTPFGTFIVNLLGKIY